MILICKTFLKDVDSTKFLEILSGNKTPNKLSSDELKITFKHPNFVRAFPLDLNLTFEF